LLRNEIRNLVPIAQGLPFNGVSSKYLQNYLNWYAYMDHIRNSKTTIKQCCITMLLTDQAYHLFKQNPMLIRT